MPSRKSTAIKSLWISLERKSGQSVRAMCRKRLGQRRLGFNVKSENGVQALAKHHAVKITHHKIIYELIDQFDDIVDMLDPEFRENKIGAAEVETVPIAKGFVAGCLVVEGRGRSGPRPTDSEWRSCGREESRFTPQG